MSNNDSKDLIQALSFSIMNMDKKINELTKKVNEITKNINDLANQTQTIYEEVFGENGIQDIIVNNTFINEYLQTAFQTLYGTTSLGTVHVDELDKSTYPVLDKIKALNNKVGLPETVEENNES